MTKTLQERKAEALKAWYEAEKAYDDADKSWLEAEEAWLGGRKVGGEVVTRDEADKAREAILEEIEKEGK